jgi:hypothetical protein
VSLPFPICILLPFRYSSLILINHSTQGNYKVCFSTELSHL